MDIEELKAMIPSETVRQYVMDTNWAFTDMQKAALLYHNSLTLEKKYFWLRVIRDNTRDEGLQKQLAEYLNQEEQAIQAFKENEDKSHIYVLRVDDADDDERYYQIQPKDYFFDWKRAYECGKKEGCSFQIAKEGVQGVGVNSNHYAELSFNRSGEAVCFQDNDCSSDDVSDWRERFENTFVTIPNPFERGDIVQFVGDKRFGVVATSQKQWAQDLAKAQSAEWRQHFYSNLLDFRIKVDFLDEEDEGIFGDAQINPIHLERYEPEEDWRNASSMDKLLLCASSLYKGKGSLSELYFFTMEYRAAKGN